MDNLLQVQRVSDLVRQVEDARLGSQLRDKCALEVNDGTRVFPQYEAPEGHSDAFQD